MVLAVLFRVACRAHAPQPDAALPQRTSARGARRQLSRAARVLALEIAAEARAEWGYASDIIARAFRAHRELGSSERRLIAETVYGLVRWDRRLDAIVDELVRGARPRGRARCRRWRATS